MSAKLAKQYGLHFLPPPVIIPPDANQKITHKPNSNLPQNQQNPKYVFNAPLSMVTQINLHNPPHFFHGSNNSCPNFRPNSSSSSSFSPNPNSSINVVVSSQTDNFQELQDLIDINRLSISNSTHYHRTEEELKNTMEFKVYKTEKCVDIYTLPVNNGFDPFATPILFKSYSEMVNYVTTAYCYSNSINRFVWEENCNPKIRKNYAWCGSSILLFEKYNLNDKMNLKVHTHDTSSFSSFGGKNIKLEPNYSLKQYLFNSPVKQAVHQFIDITCLKASDLEAFECYIRENTMVVLKPIIDENKEITFYVTFLLYNNVSYPNSNILKDISIDTTTGAVLEYGRKTITKGRSAVRDIDYSVYDLVCRKESEIQNFYHIDDRLKNKPFLDTLLPDYWILYYIKNTSYSKD